MNIQQGYFYFISDLYFDRVQDKELLQNKESGTKRPAYSSDDITKIKTDIILKTDELFNVEENSDEETNEDEV